MLPATLGHVPGVSCAVTGETAGTQQFTAVTKKHGPVVFAFVLGLAFLLLLVTFRSLVIPLTAIALNLLSVGAAYGVLVWIFQDGHLQGLLGFHSAGAIVTWLPLFLFAILFGLSMDYHVFIVSRIKELADRGASTEEAVERGIAGTAGTVTAAAAVMVAVFAVFATLSDARNQADGRRAGGRGADRRDRDQGGAASCDDEAARQVELVPAALAAMATSHPSRASRRPAADRGRLTMRAAGSRYLAGSARGLAFQLSALVLAPVWFSLLVTGWSVTLSSRSRRS